ncbi:hypothetical protein BJV78DRAFT_1285495 [Lactifluus subvellereus]|nr:hypothetical protein BJV78DRAFT_1285495 [Lactifluus subvellereus]
MEAEPWKAAPATTEETKPLLDSHAPEPEPESKPLSESQVAPASLSAIKDVPPTLRLRRCHNRACNKYSVFRYGLRHARTCLAAFAATLITDVRYHALPMAATSTASFRRPWLFVPDDRGSSQPHLPLPVSCLYQFGSGALAPPSSRGIGAPQPFYDTLATKRTLVA